MEWEISRADWKLYRRKMEKWQERYITRLLGEYQELLSGEGAAAEKFWELEKRVLRDREYPGVIIEVRKGDVLPNIATLLLDGVIGEEDLEGFSPELRHRILAYTNVFRREPEGEETE